MNQADRMHHCDSTYCPHCGSLEDCPCTEDEPVRHNLTIQEFMDANGLGPDDMVWDI